MSSKTFVVSGKKKLMLLSRFFSNTKGERKGWEDVNVQR